MKRLASAAILAFLLAVLPLNARAAELLIPVGRIVGLQMKTGTVTVAAFDDALGKNAKSAGLRIGDEILKIEDRTVTCPEDVHKALSQCEDYVTLTIRRNGRQSHITVAPQPRGDEKKLGVYLRQGVSGIGTVTWYDPSTGSFAALGHGVSGSRGMPVQMTGGCIYPAEILSVKMGKSGEPGQLKGSASPETPCGILRRNTPQGVFGTAQQPWPGEPLPAAEWGQLSTGPATILSTISGTTPREYSVEIVKVYTNDRPDGRNMLLKITDPELLQTTGGIVQGMSGSPIIQDGKLIGAVTHVLVNDPTMGYGIFIQNMLDAAG